MTTITRFTKEQLLKRLEEQMSSARYALGFVQDSEILRDIEMDLHLAEIARASLEVPYIFGYVLCNHGTPDTDFVFADRDSAEGTAEHLNDTDTHDLWTVEPICRAAMLQGSQPVSNRDELPMDYMQGHKDGLEWAARLAEANHPQTGDWLYDDPIELAKAIRKGPHMPELKLVQADADDNFYSWFGRFWHENYQQKNYTTSAKQMLGTMAEFAFRAGRESATQAGNSPVIPDGSEDTKRLDWLDAQNKRLNEYYGTLYGWKFDANFQRNAMMLNDSNYPVMTVRQAIDQAIAAAPQQEAE